MDLWRIMIGLSKKWDSPIIFKEAGFNRRVEG
jgi:hypothetical protein